MRFTLRLVGFMPDEVAQFDRKLQQGPANVDDLIEVAPANSINDANFGEAVLMAGGDSGNRGYTLYADAADSEPIFDFGDDMPGYVEVWQAINNSNRSHA